MVNLIHLLLFTNIQHYFDKRNKKGHKRLVAVSDEKKLAPRKGKTTQDTDAYYVFNRENDEGFIIVSGDDKTIPVLGYCDKDVTADEDGNATIYDLQGRYKIARIPLLPHSKRASTLSTGRK